MNVGLAFTITERRLEISIPVDILAFAAENIDRTGSGGEEAYQIKIKDKDAFARSVVKILTNEAEDGSTRVTRMLDLAFDEVIAQGEDGPDYGDLNL